MKEDGLSSITDRQHARMLSCDPSSVRYEHTIAVSAIGGVGGGDGGGGGDDDG